MKPKLTVVVRRGLKEICALAYADFEQGMSDETPRWNKKEAEQLERAFEWIRHLEA